MAEGIDELAQRLIQEKKIRISKLDSGGYQVMYAVGGDKSIMVCYVESNLGEFLGRLSPLLKDKPPLEQI